MEKKATAEISFITWVRAISVFLILFCHLAQTSANPYLVMSSQLFNVGVNIFIIISGFLFGKTGTVRPYGKWLLKRAKRIFVPYWLFLVVLLVLQIAQGHSVNPVAVVFSALGIHGFRYVFSGTEHTWFITAILMCYAITPILDAVAEKWLYSHKKIIFACAIGLLGVLAICLVFLSLSAVFIPVPFYVVAFLLGKMWDKIMIKKAHVLQLLVVGTLSFVLRFALRMWIDGTVVYSTVVASYTHYIAAFCFFAASSWIFNRRPWKVVSFISDNSFEIYLYHYMFMWPPLSVMNLSNSWMGNGLVAIILSIIVAWMMRSVGRVINKYLFGTARKRRKKFD